MHHTHHRLRTHRLALCTALALGAGLVSAGPATAANALAAQASLAAPATAPATAAVATRAKPRFDRDGDGRSDRVFRSADTGRLTVVLSRTGSVVPFTIGHDDLTGTGSLEVLPADDLWGTTATDLLTLSAGGALRLHSSEAPASTGKGLVWQGEGWQIYNKVLAPGDLTKDGRQDLLARTPAGALYLYAGTGRGFDSKGPFKARVAVGGGWQAYDQLVGTNDLDGDAIADLVARTPRGDLYFYKGTGSATVPFKARVHVGGGWQVYNQVVGADDLNGDGRADLLARTHSGAFYQYLSTGGGKFGARTYAGGGGQGLSYYLGQGGVPAHGKHNLFAVDKTGTAFTYGTLANGQLAARKPYGGAGENEYHWAMTNGHALDDADRANVLTAYNPTLWNDRGSVASDSGAFYGYAETLGPGDLTGDGKGDVLGLDPWGNVLLHPGLKQSDPPRVGPALKVGTAWQADTLVGTGDVTGDGRPDLVSRDGTGLYLHAGTGSAAAPFAARVLIGRGWDVYAHLAAPGDTDGDGRSDLIAVTPGGDVYRYSATGLGGAATFASRVKIASGWAYVHLS
ncbi:FG-GAP repeat domain-containing protein [Streptomyces sp. bgisy095]|uniref:FG-GAP repeat domain-containing protein n=1 Tax=unclassified Streptomyces TaxID=2593676 RepID=UPI003D72F839